jgi:hypothetical protein
VQHQASKMHLLVNIEMKQRQLLPKLASFSQITHSFLRTKGKIRKQKSLEKNANNELHNKQTNQQTTQSLVG